MFHAVAVVGAWCIAGIAAPADQATLLYEAKFSSADYGTVPDGWTDRIAVRPSRGWIVDGAEFLRPTAKRTTGLLTYDGYLTTAKPARQLVDAMISAEFKK